MFGGFSATKLKPQLKMAQGRISILSNKKTALLKQSMREVAVMLAEDPPKEEKARIRAESLIRDDQLIEALEILQLECELLHERIKLLEYSQTCPNDLISVISTLIWASHRVDVPELLLIRKQFRAKYGKQFEENAMRNVDGCLNERVVSKLSVQPPAAYLVQVYLEKICEQYEVDWTPQMKLSTDNMIEPMAAPVGYSVPVGQGTGLGPTVTATAIPITGTSTNSLRVDREEEAEMKRNGGIPPGIPPSVGTRSVGAGSATDFEEPDIFVPGAPSAPPGSKPNNDYSSHDDEFPSVGGGGGNASVSSGRPSVGDTRSSGGGDDNMSASYSDLAARFSQLKK